jgi:hypothetical protein
MDIDGRGDAEGIDRIYALIYEEASRRRGSGGNVRERRAIVFFFFFFIHPLTKASDPKQDTHWEFHWYLSHQHFPNTLCFQRVGPT